MKQYDHKKIEKKWQKDWTAKKIYKTSEKNNSSTSSGRLRRKFYILDMFPYPSGEGLHVGHPRGYIGTDIYSRFKRMQGYNVLHPMGFDSFGLPAENYALKHKIHPEQAVKKNIKRYKDQLSVIGFDYDWEREVVTSDPNYYKWTQWIFLKLFEKGLAYESFEPINWCPSCKTGLANEDLENGVCERCGSEVEKKPIRQWVLKITKYADRLLKDLDGLDWLESDKEAQRNWIGRSEGVEIDFKIKGKNEVIKIFTTRPDTIDGVTFLVLALDHPLSIKYKEKLVAINPHNNEEIPVFSDEYVLSGYGTGAIMAVPQHDERDREFANKHNLPILDKPLLEAESVIKKVGGQRVVKYRLRDWVFSRQRYWGEPIPIIHCLSCGPVAVPEKDLPVTLPKVKSYEPTGTGESPLAGINKWVNVKCPKCKGPGKRETNTMPSWAGSSAYYLRYVDPKNKKVLVDNKKEKYWSPVDLYVGGTEHTTRHLIYARFWHKFLKDIKLVHSKEPFAKLRHQGLIMASDGRKMSKRWGNVVNPDEVVDNYGADTLRVYEMFLGPFDQTVAWNTDSIMGPRRFLERVWKLQYKIGNGKIIETERALHKTIKKVTEDVEGMNFNTCISSMMILVNEMENAPHIEKDDYKSFLQILAPFAPHISEEIWNSLGERKSIHLSLWPKYDNKKIKEDTIKIAVQVNGKVRGEVEVPSEAEESLVLELVKKNDKIAQWIEGKEIRKFIYVKNRLANIVI